MLENVPISAGGAPISAGAAAKAKSATPGAASNAQGAAFHALIEKLTTEARELEQASRNVESAADLAQAVDRAHDSLQDALSLSDGLLEAYRRALLTQPAGGAANSSDLLRAPSAHEGARPIDAREPR